MPFNLKNTGIIRPGSAIKVPGSGTPTIPPPSGTTPRVPIESSPGTATVWSVALTAPRMRTRLIAMQNTPYLYPNPYYVSAADELTFAVLFEGATSVSSPSVKAYKNRTDVSSTIFPSGSPSASSNVVTLPTAKAWTSGERYVIELVATVDGMILTKALSVVVRTTGGE